MCFIAVGVAQDIEVLSAAKSMLRSTCASGSIDDEKARLKWEGLVYRGGAEAIVNVRGCTSVGEQIGQKGG